MAMKGSRMPISPYLRWLRNHVGRDLVLMPGVTGIVTDQEGRILLVEDISTGWWALPGGAIDPDERPADAIVREMREELGVEVEPTAVLGVFGGPELTVEYGNGDRVQYVTTVFACQVISGELTADGEELAQFRFTTPDEQAEMLVAPWVQHALTMIDTSAPGAWFDPPASSAGVIFPEPGLSYPAQER
ncbi:NUDIX domain-containing protein [Streptosporangium sp. NPDC006013]|uniref:NUDIX domain-containing protein n=1 Tax=Streptosporangium sp. NPDC006013 TaxID=3155596 RepID=UPI0033AD5C57